MVKCTTTSITCDSDHGPGKKFVRSCKIKTGASLKNHVFARHGSKIEGTEIAENWREGGEGLGVIQGLLWLGARTKTTQN